MGVLVVGVGIVVMRVLHRGMPVPMAMHLPGLQDQPRFIRVIMQVVRVVRVFVRMLQGLVDVGMRMPLRQMQPDAHAHQQTRDNQSHAERFSVRQCQYCAEKRCRREISPGPGRAKVPQTHDEERKTDPIGQKPDHQRASHGG